MSMSKTDFKNAFREVVSLEFDHIPKDEGSIDFTFSEKFDKRMEKLISSQKKAYWNLVNTAAKRVAIICVILLTVLTAACSVKAIREPIVEFFTEVYETFTRYFFEGDTVDTITKEYSVNDLPNGFIQTDKIKDSTSIITVYENEVGDIIEFSQTISDGTDIYFDTENNKQQTMVLNNLKVNFYESDDKIHAIWVKDTYVLDIIYYGNGDVETVKKLVLSVE